MPNIDLSILNQRQTPAFYADVFANRPAAGFVGRIFVSTDTYAFYRDNGTGWDLIGGPGTGTVTGSGAAGQVAFWSGSSLISGENNLWWDSTNNHFGINTNTPGTAADIHHDQSTILQLNQTTATNDTRIAFQNAGSSKWRVGNFYSAGSNDYKVNDAVLNINRFTIKSSSGQTFVGDETTSSGLFVVNNSSGDAHIVALGATAPSIRVRNAGVGATLQFGLGLATTTNNFIQGATGGEFCIFNDSLTAQPILFGIKDAGLGNTQEAARISPARNFLIGTTTDAGQKIQVNGTALITGAATFNSSVNANSVVVKNSGVPAILAYRDLDVTVFGTVGQGIEFGAKSSSTYISGAAIYGTLDNPATTGSLVLQTLTSGSLTTKLTIASTGAATFSSSVTASGNIKAAGTGNRTVTIVGQGDGSIILAGDGTTYATTILFKNTDGGTLNSGIYNYAGGGVSQWLSFGGNAYNNSALYAFSSNNIGIGTTTDNGDKLQINGFVSAANRILAGSASNTSNAFSGQNNSVAQATIYAFNHSASGYAFFSGQGINYFANNVLIGTTSNGGSKLRIVGLPTSAAGLSSGDIYSNAGILTIVP